MINAVALLKQSEQPIHSLFILWRERPYGLRLLWF
jgi:hypothetical protein